MTIKGLYNKIIEVDSLRVVTEVMTNNVEVLDEINKSQLYEGKTKSGNDLSPTYFEDPYFDTLQEAINYSNWKDRITPNSRRTPGVPNLIINGYYYASRRITVSGDKIIYSSDYIEAELLQKYGPGINGLGGPFKQEFLKLHLRPDFQTKITAITGLKFK